MSEMVRLSLMLALAGAALTALVGALVWHLNEERRIRRALARVLGGPPEAMLVAHGEGRGAGFSFDTGAVAVAWNSGAWCLVYGLDELVGAELVVDDSVVARAHRGEARRPLDRLPADASSASLRLIFDDPAYPDFEITLWPRRGRRRPGGDSARDALAEANRWLARVEAILRRPAAAVVRPHEAAPAPAPLWRNEDEFEEDGEPHPI
ncbi:MAG TPA: hypothetical protein VFE03_13150 [Caulobacteraceae bacterium]|jgi:hypothetical protein|nr:hypothetical protein [Caulobacteraceae bacterium]